MITGKNLNEKDSEWNRSVIYGEVDTVYKPPYLHSSAAIYILIKYPNTRPIGSFYNMISKAFIEKECLKIATDVMKSDVDGIAFIEHSDELCFMK